MTSPRGAEPGSHLSDADLFTLAVPPAGEPEALPGHLSECLACSRALSEWKTAVRDLADEDADVLAQRSEAEWNALEEKTLSALRRNRGRAARTSWRWLAAIAAALLLFALALPLRQRSQRPAPAAAASSAEMSPQDQADDALLRDVARLSRGDEGAGDDWDSLVPDPQAVEKSGKL